jgi:hypothetical protein
VHRGARPRTVSTGRAAVTRARAVVRPLLPSQTGLAARRFRARSATASRERRWSLTTGLAACRMGHRSDGGLSAAARRAHRIRVGGRPNPRERVVGPYGRWWPG